MTKKKKIYIFNIVTLNPTEKLEHILVAGQSGPQAGKNDV